jgi:CheY-like chemotaxis protein
VLATLHTNDAIGTIARFGDLDMDGAAIVDTLRGAVAQRLLRRLCPKCAVPATDPPTPEEASLAAEYGVRPARRARGCNFCGQSGYQGRLPVTEMLVMTPTLADLIAKRGTPEEMSRAAIREGMHTLRDSALERVRRGETSLEEVQRVIGLGDDAAVRSGASSGLQSTAQVPASRAGAPGPESAGGGEDEVTEVLLVDDDKITRTIGRGLLSSAGYRVTEAGNGLAALDLLQKHHYSLIVLDLEMPEMDGRQVLEAVRSGIQTATIPVIVLTGNEDPEAEIRLMDLGADDYIRKPIDPPRFVTRVRATLRRSNLA